MGSHQLPRPRLDVRARRSGKRLILEDDLRAVRYGVDQLTVKILQAVGAKPHTPETLCRALKASPADVRQRVDFLNRQLVFDTPRAREHAKIWGDATPTAPSEDPGTLPLRYPEELRHGCVACGGCCHGTDVGPLKPDDIDRVKEIDWSPHLPVGVDPDDWLVTLDGPGGRPITLMGHREGRCVFLDGDKLCVIHKVAGAPQKPTICRQFPYTFTRTPGGIDVSFSTECRAWWQAKQNGRPPADDEVQIRALIGEGGPVLSLPDPVCLWRGAVITQVAWLELREELLAGVRAARDMAGIVSALVTPLRARLAALETRVSAEEGFTADAAWSFAGRSRQVEPADRSSRCARVGGALDELLASLVDGYLERDQGADADRHQRARWLVKALFSGRRLTDLIRFEHEHEIWQDMVLACLYSHEPARRGAVLSGIAQLVLRVVAARLLAGLLAQASLRGRVGEQDTVDAMAFVTKVFRGSALLSVFAERDVDLVELFVFGAEVFDGGEAPAPRPTILHRL